MTDFKSSEFNDQKLTKAEYSNQKDSPRKLITKISAKQTFIILSVHFIFNWKGMQNSFSRNASTYFMELSDLIFSPSNKSVPDLQHVLRPILLGYKKQVRWFICSSIPKYNAQIIQKCYKCMQCKSDP